MRWAKIAAAIHLYGEWRKDCSNCMIPHKRGTGYDYIIKHFSAVMELAKKK